MMQWIKRLILATAIFSVFTIAEPATETTTTININTATAEMLTNLKGIGPSKAEAIVQYRNMHGPFMNAEELTQVKGIGQATIDKNRPLLAFEPNIQ